MDEITIRRAESPADYRACQEAQRRSWGIVEENYIVPIATMVGAQFHGGLVLGAFLADGEAVGMSFAFLGRVSGRPCLYSQLTGIVPGYQDQGLGTKLKMAQRDIARGEGIATIAWAFDPLQAGNARFNLDKLAATAGHYVVDMYGPRTDALNAGTPTDRLIAEWPTSPRPRPLATFQDVLGLPPLIESRPSAGGIGELVVHDPPASDALFLEIPADLAALKRGNADEAARWRLAVRSAFLKAFDRGYRAVGFVRGEHEGTPRLGYLLDRSGRYA